MTSQPFSFATSTSALVVASSDAAEKPRTPDGSVFLSTSYGCAR